MEEGGGQMGRIPRTESNLFPMPRGAFIVNRVYVYINTGNKYVPASARKNGGRGYTGHDIACIGVLKTDGEPGEERMFYGNDRYHRMLEEAETGSLEPPRFSDSLAAGLRCAAGRAAETSGLLEDLTEVFGEENALQILDCCQYMLSSRTACLDLYPYWARDHMLFSEDIMEEEELGQFLTGVLTVPAVRQFLDRWTVRNIGSGNVHLYSDSMDDRTRAEGVSEGWQEHAEEDPVLRIDTVYAVRSEDGLPLTFLHAPGTIRDLTPVPEMLDTVKHIRETAQAEIHPVLVCDRGFLSVSDLRILDSLGMEYIVMLNRSTGLGRQMAESAADCIRDDENEIFIPGACEDDRTWGLSEPLDIGGDGPLHSVHVIWETGRYLAERAGAKRKIERERAELEEFLEDSEEDPAGCSRLSWIPPYFSVQIAGYTADEAAAEREIMKSGMSIFLASDRMTASECLEEYWRKESAWSMLQVLKDRRRADEIGIAEEQAAAGKSFLWFTASVLHALISRSTAELRKEDPRRFDVPGVVAQLEAVKAERNPATGKRERRYRLTDGQKAILDCLGADGEQLDREIREAVC